MWYCFSSCNQIAGAGYCYGEENTLMRLIFCLTTYDLLHINDYKIK